MGNGGSACDAAHVAVEFGHPIVEKRRALPATVLGSSPALLTAVGNDTDFARVFVDRARSPRRGPIDAVLGDLHLRRVRQHQSRASPRAASASS